MSATFVALWAAVGLIGWSSLSAAMAQERSVALRVASLPPQNRALRVTYYTVAAGTDLHAGQVAAAVGRFSQLTGRRYHVTVWHPIAPADESGTSFVVPSDPAADAIVLNGRLPRHGCTARLCEAVALSGRLRSGQVVRVGPVRVEIVGVGSMRPVALPASDKLGGRQLLVTKLAAPLERLARAQSGSTSVTTAPLAATRLRASSLGAVISRLHRTAIALNRSDSEGLVQATAPTAALRSIQQRGVVARDRLLLISGQAAALVIAFAAFAARARRRELLLLEGQLVDFGASRTQSWTAGALEVVLPAVAAAIAAFGSILAAAMVQRPRQESLGRFLSAALPGWTIVTMTAVLIASAGLLAVSGRRPAPRRFGVGPLEAAAVVAFAVVVWQALSTGDLNASQIAGSASHSPVLLLLPALTFFVSAVLLLRLLPFLVRLAERASRTAPTGVRLAFLGAARRPAEAATATTFLAVAVGVATFSLAYRATLEQQARDQANFAAGAQWRVIESASRAPVTTARGVFTQPVATKNDVAPLTRYASVSGEQPVPVLRETVQQLRVSAGVNQAGTPLTLLALPAPRLPDVLGWRNDFASASRDRLVHLLRPRPVTLHGPRIARDATVLRVWAKTKAPYPAVVALELLLPGQDVRSVRMGVVAPGSWQLLAFKLPAELRGSELVGVDLEPATELGPPYTGVVWLGPFQQRRTSGWSKVGSLAGWTTVTDPFNQRGIVSGDRFSDGPVSSAVRYDRNETSLSVIRPQLHLPAAVPVLASPSVAASTVDGLGMFSFAGGVFPLRFRVVGTTKFFPTITGAHRFIVADYGTVYAELNTLFPGIAPPSEAWFFEPQQPSFATRLSQSPFHVDHLISDAAQRRTLSSDPLSSGAQSVLLVTALVAALLGLVGMVVAISTSLRDENAIMAEYEALGIRPSILAGSTALRLAALSAVGLAAGVAGGFLALRLIGALVAVTAGGTAPIPPIRAVAEWTGAALLIAAMGTAAFLAAWLLSRRAFRRPVAERLRI